ncbi:MAG: winged helix-turn-helix domain-containing protein [Thermoproteus sp.]
MAKYDLDVIARILLALLDGPTRRTSLYYRSRLSYPRFVQYLSLLEERGLVAERDGLVTLTEKGLKVAAELDRILDEYLDF